MPFECVCPVLLRCGSPKSRAKTGACRRGIRRKRCNPAVSTISPMRIPGHRTPIRGFVGSRRGPGRRNCNDFGACLLGRPPKRTPQTAECPSQDTPLPHRTPPIRPQRDPGSRSGPLREWQHCPSLARKRPVRGTVGGNNPSVPMRRSTTPFVAPRSYAVSARRKSKPDSAEYICKVLDFAINSPKF